MKNASAQFCVYTLGPFSLERRRDDGRWETIDQSEWGDVTHGTHTQSLLGYMLCCPGRQALVASVMEKLWPPEKGLACVHDYMQRANARLRHIMSEGMYFKKTAHRTKYELADQSLVWSDADDCIASMRRVEQSDLTTEERVALLEEMERLFRRGRFLEEEKGRWAYGPREELTKLFCRCRLYLAEAYQTQGKYPQEEQVAEAWLRDSPFDETALRHLMLALHTQNLTSEALRRYRETATLAKKEGTALSSNMKAFAEGLPYEPRGQPDLLSQKQQKPGTYPGSRLPPPYPDSQTTVLRSDKAVVVYASQIQIVVQPLPNEARSSILQSLLTTSPHLVESNTTNEGLPHPFDVVIEGIMDEESGLEENNLMDTQRREMLQLLKRLGLVGATTGIPVAGQQDLNADVRGALYPSGPGDKEVKYLEQRIRYYWQDRYNVTIAPADLMSHVIAYIREATSLLKRSLRPSMRTRLCACLSQGMLLIGANFHDLGQFQTARECFQTGLEAAYEANHNILQALAWRFIAYSWMRSNEKDRHQHALDSMLKASGCASLESDLAVQCLVQVGSAELYAYLKDTTACLEALKNASKLDGFESGDWYFIHHLNRARVNGHRGICLQQLYRPDAPDTYPLLEEARQTLEEALAQPNVVLLQRAFCAVDMAQVHARKGEVESACDYATGGIAVAGVSAPLRQRLLMVRTHLEPYIDVQVVKDLDREIRALFSPEQPQEM